VSSLDAQGPFWQDWLERWRPQLRLGVRITIASLATFAIAELLGLAQSLWAVLTAVIVTQASVGGALKAGVDRFVGSIGGAVWGVAVVLVLPHEGAANRVVALGVAVAPLAVVAAINPAYRVAPATAVIIVLAPVTQADGAVQAAIQRTLGVGLGSIVALAVALLVLPERARGHLARAAGAALETMAKLALVLKDGVARGVDQAVTQALHDRLRAQIGQAEAAAAEALRERRTYLAAGPDPEPLCRTLRRLRSDLMMIAQAESAPAPPPILEALAGPAAGALAAAAALMDDVAAAITHSAAPPSAAELDGALDAYAAAVAAMRRSGATRNLPDETVGRIFGLAFAAQDLRRNLHDLLDRAAEMR